MQNDYLQDTIFLKKIYGQKKKDVFIKIILLSFNELPQGEIQGLAIDGSINCDGSSINRRSGSFTFLAKKEITNIEDPNNLISMNKKIRLYKGYKNDLADYQKYGEIIWIPLGLFVVVDASIDTTTTGSKISLSVKDKMCLLDGSISGTFPATVTLDHEEGDPSNKLLVFDILYTLLVSFGNEDPSNILISDVAEKANSYGEFLGEDTIYVYKKNETNYQYEYSHVAPEIYLYSFTKNSKVGYLSQSFTCPSGLDLSFKAGAALTGALSLIADYFNYEYFYDVDGRFIWREKRNYVNKAFSNINTLNGKNYITYFTGSQYLYTFGDQENIISINSAPQYSNIKNDFIISGAATSNNMYHLAIDSKPSIVLANQYMWLLTTDSYVFTSDKVVPADAKQLVGVPCQEWREELYRQGLVGYSIGFNKPNNYASELRSFWRSNYMIDLTTVAINGTVVSSDAISTGVITSTPVMKWSSIFLNDPASLTYWLDFIDDNSEMGKFSISKIGRRTLSANDEKITTMFSPEIENITWLQPSDSEGDFIAKQVPYCKIKEEDKELFTNSNVYNSLYDSIVSYLYANLTYNNTISLNMISLDYLEPNSLTYIRDDNSNINGDYFIQSFNIPLELSGAMTVNAHKTNARL